jgi:hypothetical protein
MDTGGPFEVSTVKLEDLEAGELKTSWGLGAVHKSAAGKDADEVAAMLEQVTVGMLISAAKGAWDVGDAMNQMFPEYKFTSAGGFLAEAWKEFRDAQTSV